MGVVNSYKMIEKERKHDLKIVSTELFNSIGKLLILSQRNSKRTSTQN